MERFQNTSLPDWDWWGKLWPTPGETLRRLGLSAGDRLVEIGSGNGYFALPAARIVEPAPVYAVDLDASLLVELDHLADQQEIDNVVTRHGDARSLSEHVPEPVDVALIANAFHGIEDHDAFVREIASVLAEGGRLVVVNWRDLPRETTTIDGEPRGPPTDLRLTLEETKAIVEGAIDGTVNQQFDIPPYHYGLVFER
ncbi:methyltransferase domain-containing protein [Haloferax mediterranei ATCC 33500]|uniref:Methyltransferase domain-containing protein n=1 Tax=Haloferax mediterranei (strain ATCC 33500 / DSM 1411 / JCM 8866 / NBRC 14739 / NCIMB 2177 / R-4) TaxID=523841 RepID=I3R4L3_HALMT|nr:class I SAM-dependent methyltransferase [Haloferax mediterranei]AFK19173.1 S-adenosylmethionine-dependent methyltransferase-like protein [Haloferax mediterranei ATCC 33500]AHZ21464.1 SAM-dependent methyltransferase [Haloferax mediterranei ATCC 33500]EMA03924.1 S-adenosylmethionine-dependent methyltransferase-like protein [Haloferax mediterranei ATCC 33500]MDX5989272.1 methyltransferase domain-containing protein [Haloferax mediterranei ATCC 33500]QCQ75643.1 methyltransferase domain-containin